MKPDIAGFAVVENFDVQLESSFGSAPGSNSNVASAFGSRAADAGTAGIGPFHDENRDYRSPAGSAGGENPGLNQMTRQVSIQGIPVIEMRQAVMSDRPVLEEMKELSISMLLDPLMTPEQRAEMRRITPFDPALIEDGTYYVATVNGRVAASGGWSRRAALFSPDAHGTGEAALLDPATESAGIRAMYTHPDCARKGLGSLVLSTALAAARFAGFRRAQLIATVAGERLYRAAGWQTEERVMVGSGGKAIVPGFRMSRAI